MDLNGLDIVNNSSYAKSVNNTAKVSETAGKDYSKATDKELMDACKEFESYFVEQMFSAMRKMVPESEFTSSSNKMMRDYYQDSLNKEYANSLTERGEGIGLAKMLYEQMKRNYDL